MSRAEEIRVLHDSPHARVTWLASHQALCFERSEAPFDNIDEARALLDVLEGLDLPRDGNLLIDTSRAPLRGDPAFETLSTSRFVPWVARFRKAAVLVRSAVGRLQVTRIRRETLGGIEVFTDRREALEFLRSKAK